MVVVEWQVIELDQGLSKKGRGGLHLKLKDKSQFVF